MGKDYDAMRADLMSRTVRQLREIARAEGICLGYDGSTKKRIVGAIVSHRWHIEREDMHGRAH